MNLDPHNPLSKLLDIDFPEVKKANWNCSYDKVTTADCCYVNVVHTDHLLANTDVDMDINHASFANPTVAPLYGRYRVKYLAFWAPDRLYMPEWLMGSKMDDDDYQYPYILPWNFRKNTSSSTAQVYGENEPIVPPTSLCAQLGLYPAYYQPLSFEGTSFPGTTAGIRASYADGINEGIIDYPAPSMAFPFLAYWDIYRNYIINTQEERFPIRIQSFREQHSVYSQGAVMERPSTPPVDKMISRSTLDKFFESIKTPDFQKYNKDVVSKWCQALDTYEDDTFDPLFSNKYVPQVLEGNEMDKANRVYFPDYHYGLAIAPFTADAYTSWIDNDAVELERQKTAMNVENGQILMESWIVASRMQNKVRKSLFKESDFAEWIDTQYGVRPSTTITKPMFLGAFISDIVFNDVVSTTQTSDDSFDGNGNLGSRAGYGRGTDNGKRNFVKFRAQEPGTFMVLQIVMPEVFYFEGRDAIFDKQNFNEEFNPAFDGIGYQDLQAGNMNMVPQLRDDPYGRVKTVTSWNQHNISVGQQPYGMEYMTKVNQLSGMMVQPSEYLGWSLGRSFNYNRGNLTFIPEALYSERGLYSTYPYPEMFTNIFKSNVVDNFQFYLSFDYKKYQPISKQFLAFHN